MRIESLRATIPRWGRLGGILCLVLLHLGLSIWGLRAAGPTSDEIAHFTAGYSYWKYNDYRLQPENGNLPQRWAGLALLLQEPALPVDGLEHIWRASDVWMIGEVFFFRAGNPIDRMLFLTRCAMLVWPLALGALVFFWSKRLWGEAGAFLSTALYAVSPTVLANGALVNSDTTAAVALLTATYCWWRCLHRAGWRTAALSVGATGLAFVSKFSCVLLIPVFAILAGWRWWHQRDELGRLARLTLIHGFGAWLAIWLFFGLRFTPEGAGMPPVEKYFLPWDQMLSLGGPMNTLIEWARDWRILPEAFINGFAHVRYQGNARNAFLFGEFSRTGWWWFFPATFLLKSTVAELITAMATTAAGIHRLAQARLRRLNPASPMWPLLAFALVYGVFSLTSNLNIGHRHILPLYPILFIAAGGLVTAIPNVSKRWFLGGLPLLSLAGCLAVAPHFLAFFNVTSGGPDRAWTKLVDSSLDWGQGLPATAQWMRDHRQDDEPIYVSYFGTDSPRFRMPDAIELSPFYSHYRPRPWVPLQPGLYAVGATMLQDVYSPFAGEWNPDKEAGYQFLRRTLLPAIESGEQDATIIDFGYGDTEQVWKFDRLRFNRLVAYLRFRRPEATLNHCMMVYRLTAEEVRVVAAGSSQELADLMEAARDQHH